MIIAGAGLAGLITAHAFPRMEVHEAAPEPRMNHRALLRFRSDAVAKLTGVEFKKVLVRKGIFREGKFREPTILEANLYSQKCLGKMLGDRSVWNLEPVTRYVAPLDFHAMLVESLGSRLHYNSPVDYVDHSARGEKLISTAPMDKVLAALSVDTGNVEFRKAGIHVLRSEVPNCDVYQTVYFTSTAHDLYRASITGSTLIAEFATARGGPAHYEECWQEELHEAFGFFNMPDQVQAEHVEQRYGKIAPIDEGLRKSLVARLTDEHGIFSIGRFATWRNLLLDDVVNDATVIKRLLTASRYDRRMAAT